MALVNQVKREINAKIVFFGPEGTGKGTNLRHIFGKLKPEFRGSMKTMNVQKARMLFFDFIPPGDGTVQGFRVRIHLYTLSGFLSDPAAWKMVLKGADGVVFVGDCARERQEENRAALEALSGYLKGYGQSITGTPTVLQFNKCDLPDALSSQEMERLLDVVGLPSFRASSRTGEGVLQTLLSLVKTVLLGLRGKGVEGIDSGDLQQVVEAPVARSLPAAGQLAAAMAQDEAAPAERVVPHTPDEPDRLYAEALEEEASEALRHDLLEEEVSEAEEEAPAGLSLTPDEAEGAGAAAFGGGELALEVAGPPQPAGAGSFRLPLTIRAGARSKTVVLKLEVTLEEE